MGFFDSFSSGISSFGSSVMDFGSSFLGGVGNVLTTVAGSPIGTQFLGDLGKLGAKKLYETIGLTPTQPVMTRGPAPGPLGRPVSPYAYAPSMSYPRDDHLLTEQRLREELLFYQPGGPGSPVRRGAGPTPYRPPFAAPPPSIPSSQPYGPMPGTKYASFVPAGGSPVPAFPIGTQASFPPSPFASLTGVTNPYYQPAGVAGSLMRQLPGFVGGMLGGEALEMMMAPGGGGGTPMFRPTMAGARAQFFRTQNPATGQDTWFRPAGRPLLWSGDLTACKRVKKIARRASRKR